jgi:hypothetical protein
MSSSDAPKIQLSPEEKRERRKQQLREAQRRFYDNHKRKERTEPVSYNPEYLRNYHKNYYQSNKERLNNQAKQRYQAKKNSSSEDEKSE